MEDCGCWPDQTTYNAIYASVGVPKRNLLPRMGIEPDINTYCHHLGQYATPVGLSKELIVFGNLFCFRVYGACKSTVPPPHLKLWINNFLFVLDALKVKYRGD